MRMAILSDIHANIEAFEAVLKDLKLQGIDKILNLGDLVGYNASPNECVDLARDVGLLSIQGNHDQAVCDLHQAESFNVFAKLAILWTRKRLTSQNMEYLNSLAVNCQMPYGLACHGTPENTSSYMALHFQVRGVLKKIKNGAWGNINVCFFGHTHRRKIWCLDVIGKVAPVEIPANGVVRLNRENYYLLNPGSVGQPRNGDPRSSYLIFDTADDTANFRLVDYDRATAMKKIMNTDLPEFFANRLMDGT